MKFLGAILTQKEPTQKVLVEYLPTPAEPSPTLNTDTDKLRRRPWPLCGVVNTSTYTYTAIPSTSSVIIKPLEIIWNNPRSKPPARIERWGLRLQSYSFRVIHKPGKDNPTGYMSRHPDQTTPLATCHVTQIRQPHWLHVTSPRPDNPTGYMSRHPDQTTPLATCHVTQIRQPHWLHVTSPRPDNPTDYMSRHPDQTTPLATCHVTQIRQPH